MTVYKIDPVPKPRMTQSDKWKTRPCVMRYRSFKDRVKELGINIPISGAKITFYIKMPKSWSNKKKRKMLLTPHMLTPDLDNYLKALFDACYQDDSFVWELCCKKLWSNIGMIEVE